MDTYFTEINHVLLASRGHEYDGFLDSLNSSSSTSKDCYKYSYFPRSITLWNQLPTTFTTADTVDDFKSMIPVSALIPIFTP
jgi:hypothetical protein